MAYSDLLRQFEKRRAEMRKLKDRGWTYARIGKKYGISRQRVAQLLTPNGAGRI